MSEVDSQIEQIEMSVQEAQTKIDKSDALARLEKNKDFKFLFLDGFFKEDAIRSVMVLASPNAANEEQQKQIQERINLIGGLYNYLHYVHLEGEQSRNAMTAYEETRDELHAEKLQSQVL